MRCAPRVLQWKAAIESLAARVAKRQLYGVVAERNCAYCSQLAGLFTVCFQCRASGGKRAFEAKAGEGAVNVAARADALDDLLPEVAALGKVQRTCLAGLLRQLAVADIDAVQRRSFQQPQPLLAL